MDAALLSNVAGALILPPEGPASEVAGACAEVMSGLFCEVVVVGEGAPEIDVPDHIEVRSDAGSAMATLRVALETVAADRVLVVPASLLSSSVELLAGLAAWPEQSAVLVTSRGEDASRELAAIYRREEALAALDPDPAADLDALLTRLAGERVSLSALGLGDLIAEAC